MSKLLKITPLESSQMTQVMSQDFGVEMSRVAKSAQVAIEESQDYKKLIEDYKACLQNKAKEFFEQNLGLIAAFLNDCGLIGYSTERGEVNSGSYVLGAEGVALISAYLDSKPKNKDAHPVQVIRNTNLITQGGSRKHSDIFLEQEQIHDALSKQVIADLKEAEGKDFNKTYIVETFGTTGGNHVLALTIRKRADEKNPLVELFDSSPAVVRNGFAATKDSVANGWCSQLIINATLKKSFADVGLVFDNDKFFNNLEPLQRGGSSYCATFACEAAHIMANRSREEHELILQKYKYPSPYGGRTEILTNPDLSDDNVMNTELVLPAKDLALSHFVGAALLPRAAELEASKRVKKGGSEESSLQRISRYQGTEGELRSDLENQLVEQKVLRQKYCHLFEMVIDERFLARGNKVNDVEFASYKAQKFSQSPYFPPAATPEFVPQTKDLIKALNGILPRFNRINCSKYHEGKSCEVIVYLGEETAAKLVKLMEENLMKENGAGCEVEKKQLGENFVGVHPKISELSRVAINIPQEKFEKLTAVMSKMAEEKKPLYIPQERLFMPPKTTKASLVDPLFKKASLDIKK